MSCRFRQRKVLTRAIGTYTIFKQETFISVHNFSTWIVSPKNHYPGKSSQTVWGQTETGLVVVVKMRMRMTMTMMMMMMMMMLMMTTNR